LAQQAPKATSNDAKAPSTSSNTAGGMEVETSSLTQLKDVAIKTEA